MSKFIKKFMIIFFSLLFLILVMGSVQAEDINETNTLTDIDSVDVVCANDGSTDVSTVKNFNQLQSDINAEESVLILNDSYKYDKASDDNYKSGVQIRKNITIVGKNNCYIDGAGSVSLITIFDNCNVILENITFKNGYYQPGDSVRGGAGIYLYTNSNLTIKNCVFENNKVKNANGGALSCENNTNTQIYNSVFRNNQASKDSSNSGKYGMGSAIIVSTSSTLKMYDTKIIKNKAEMATVLVMSYRDNGAAETSYAYVERCLFENNTSNRNGAFYLDEYGKGKFINTTFRNNAGGEGGTLILDSSKEALVQNCIFERNSGTSGGAIRLAHDFATSNVKIIDSKFIKNTAKYGGAIYSDGGKLEVLNCTFNSNSASESGGAIREINNGEIKVTNSSFTSNSAKLGGAIYADTEKASSSNCKYSKNSASTSYPDVYGVTKIQISKVNSYFGNVELKVKITSPWEPLIIQEVRVKLVKGSAAYYTEPVKTDANGIATLKAPEKTPVGKYSVVLTRYAGKYSVNSLKIEVFAVPCTVSFKSVTFPYSGLNSVKGTVINTKTNKGMSGTKINVKVYTGKTYKLHSIKLGADGSFNIATSKLKAGKHTIEISKYDSNIKLAKFTSYIKIKKATANIVVPQMAKKNSKISVKIKNTYNNKPIKKVTFKIKMNVGKKHKKTVVLKTTSKGVLKFNLKNLPKGKCKMTISTNNKNYNINQKFTVKITK